VAVVDSGIDATHPDLNVAGGVNCSNGQSFEDAFGHGTMVAGIIGAKDYKFGVVGVVPGAGEDHLPSVSLGSRPRASHVTGGESRGPA
jgi:subtilisin family serine protease